MFLLRLARKVFTQGPHTKRRPPAPLRPCLHKTLFLALFAAATAWLSWGIVAQEKGKTDKRDLQAKQAAEQFMNAITKPEDIESVMKAVDVPFFFDGREIENRDQLKTILQSIIDEASGIQHNVRAVSNFGSLPEMVFSDHDHKVLEKILEKQDRIVFFQVQRRVIAIAVRIKENKAKVAGIRPDLSLLTLVIVAQAAEKRDKRTVQAREIAKATAQQFLKAQTAKDLDCLVELADVPLFSDGRIIKDRDELKKKWKSALDRSDQGQVPTDVFLIASYAGMRELFREPRSQVADGFFAKDDWAVFVRGGRKNKGGMIFVRVREGKGKVIGVGE